MLFYMLQKSLKYKVPFVVKCQVFTFCFQCKMAQLAKYLFNLYKRYAILLLVFIFPASDYDFFYTMFVVYDESDVTKSVFLKCISLSCDKIAAVCMHAHLRFSMPENTSVTIHSLSLGLKTNNII